MATANLCFAHMEMMTTMPKLDPSSSLLPSSFSAGRRRYAVRRVRCTQVQQQVESGILCEPCNGTGWLLCDFCKGQKTNVKSENNRLYRRCPSCRAVGYILCSKCKVFKCVTFPNNSDGEELTF